MAITEEKKFERPPPLTGGPLGLGDPDDRRLRKSEKDIIIANRIRDAAREKCADTLKTFLSCAKESGVLVVVKCRRENDANNECIAKWAKDPQLIKEVTDKYLDARSHFRRTGEPIEKYERKKRKSGLGIC